MSRASPAKRPRSRGIASHFHCYLLRSLDPKHPVKTYVGFTTDPHRRIRQHNGILKAGGAKRTRRAGRPWQFVGIVHGFCNQKAGLQFEWAWQHCDKSLAVRRVLGNAEARKLKRKRGVSGQLRILKTLVTECEEIYDAHNLTLYFLEEQHKASFDKIKLESGLELPDWISCRLISSFEEMPFWKDRPKPKRSRQAKENTEQQKDCMLCHRPLGTTEALITCRCSKKAHELCADMHMEDNDGMCPHCDELLDVEFSFSESEASGIGGDDDSFAGNVVNELSRLDLEDDDEVVELSDSSEVASLEDSDESLGPPFQPVAASSVTMATNNVICIDSSSDDDESPTIGEAAVSSKPKADTDIIDLCSP